MNILESIGILFILIILCFGAYWGFKRVFGFDVTLTDFSIGFPVGMGSVLLIFTIIIKVF